jgi:hypothetical protein
MTIVYSTHRLNNWSSPLARGFDRRPPRLSKVTSNRRLVLRQNPNLA